MPGVGTKTAITTDRAFPALLDITRLTSRVGRGPLTGIDRVELAYLEWCLATDAEFWSLGKVSDGLVILDRTATSAFHDRIVGKTPWGGRDLRAKFGIRTPAARGAAEAGLRRLASFRMKHAAQIGDALNVDGLRYLNVGHSNLSERTLNGISEAGITMMVFVHDVIPLELPQLQRPKTVTAFHEKMAAVSQYAQFVITNSKDSVDRIQAAGIGKDAALSYAHLGVSVDRSSAQEPSENRPYFVTIGTIEPRKNHMLLLEIWEELGDHAPQLHIVGQRGWKNADVFGLLDQGHPRITEHGDMTDAHLWTLLSGAHGLLFPSLAEGYGLPSLEAAALGVPVICGDLAIHRELLGAYPVYANTQDRQFWKKTMIEHADQDLGDLRATYAPRIPHIPTWDEHFAHVNHVVGGRH